MVAGTEPRPSVARPTVIIATVCAFTIKCACNARDTGCTPARTPASPQSQPAVGSRTRTLHGPQLLLPRAGERRWRALFRRWRPSGSYCRWQLLGFALLTAGAYRVVGVGFLTLSKPGQAHQSDPAAYRETPVASAPSDTTDWRYRWLCHFGGPGRNRTAVQHTSTFTSGSFRTPRPSHCRPTKPG